MSTTATPAPVPYRGVVALDGPSGSGKSSVSRAVARRLHARYLDTGSMYRAATWAALDRGLDLSDTAKVAELARTLELDVRTDPDAPGIAVDGVEVTSLIRTTRISEAVSTIATNLAVRKELVRRQRAIVGAGGVVAEGRDITTVVAPDADVRILLTASETARLSRRAREVHGSDDDDAIAATKAQVLHRDARDSTVVDFQTAADGVVRLDTSTLTFDEVVEAVLRLVADRASAVGSTR